MEYVDGGVQVGRDDTVQHPTANLTKSPAENDDRPGVANADNANEWAFFDLRFDPEQLLDGSDELLRDAIDGNMKKIRRASLNAQPGLLPIVFTPENIRGGRLPTETYLKRADQVRFLVGNEWASKINRFSSQGSWAHKTIIKPPGEQGFDADLLMFVRPVVDWKAEDYVLKAEGYL